MARSRSRKIVDAYARRGAVQEQYEVVLIVCEGEKTEPGYFNRLRSVHRLSSANVRITPADGTDPMSIVSFAEAEMDRDDFDRVYCVFDRNGHDNYEAALQKVNDSTAGKTGKLVAITSWPCFEIWLLLHYKFTSAAFEKAGGESSCDRVVRELKKHYPSYEKGRKNVFDELNPMLVTATKHAKQLQRHNQDTGSLNPATRVHELVEYLMKLKPA
jgi:hypothetical protein